MGYSRDPPAGLARTRLWSGDTGNTGVLGSTGGYRGVYVYCTGYSRALEVLSGQSGVLQGTHSRGPRGRMGRAHVCGVLEELPAAADELEPAARVLTVPQGSQRDTHRVLTAYSRRTHRGTRGRTHRVLTGVLGAVLYSAILCPRGHPKVLHEYSRVLTGTHGYSRGTPGALYGYSRGHLAHFSSAAATRASRFAAAALRLLGPLAGFAALPSAASPSPAPVRLRVGAPSWSSGVSPLRRNPR
jgi:hypothetical protein